MSNQESQESDTILGLARQLVESYRDMRPDLEQAIEMLQHMAIKAADLEEACESQKEEISRLNKQILESETCRKKLHNTILGLKGNIRVFCRVRPTAAEEATIVYDPDGGGISFKQDGKEHSFVFDRVFHPCASQQDVFMDVSELVQSAMDGQKVCIFAYGQTGSGKTYTMMGTSGDEDEKGLIPRSLEQVFMTGQNLADEGWKYEMEVSVLEIHKDTICDLLSHAEVPLIIMHDEGNTFVRGLTKHKVSSYSEVSTYLESAIHRRSVGRTNMNECSSRSHFILTLNISAVHESTTQQVHGTLNLIDLAGSERFSKSGVTEKSQQEEAIAINQSLTALGNVISAIRKKECFIPFRRSKLTDLLQPYLGGDSKTMMFVNISPDLSSMQESINSLRFAQTVNFCPKRIPRHG